jgi:hypothetical protein
MVKSVTGGFSHQSQRNQGETRAKVVVQYRKRKPLGDTVQYSTVQYSTVQYSTVQYSTVQ